MVIFTQPLATIGMKPDIDMLCPKCSRKAAFYAPNIVRWTRVLPDNPIGFGGSPGYFINSQTGQIRDLNWEEFNNLKHD